MATSKKATKEEIRVTNFTNMKADDAKTVVDMLNDYLASLQIFYHNLHGYHWHVQGPLFTIVHEKTEAMYNQVALQIDEVAERILMLDGVPARCFDDVKKLSKIAEEGPKALSDGEAISMAILESIKVLTDLERKGIDTAEEAGDPVTADMLTGYLAEREKHAWMLASALK